MDLKETLGELYTPEIEQALQGKKFVDLKDGEYVSKDKYLDQINKFNSLNAEKVKLQESFDEVNATKLTSEEMTAKRIEQLEAELKNQKLANNKAEVINILQKGGLSEEDYSEIVDSLVKDDLDTSKALANSIVKTISSKVEASVGQAKENFMQNTPAPEKGNSNVGAVTREQFLQMSSAEMVKFKQENPALFSQYIQK